MNSYSTPDTILVANLPYLFNVCAVSHNGIISLVLHLHVCVYKKLCQINKLRLPWLISAHDINFKRIHLCSCSYISDMRLNTRL